MGAWLTQDGDEQPSLGGTQGLYELINVGCVLLTGKEFTSNLKPERIEIFQFKNKNSQAEFKKLTSNTTDFSSCFENDLAFEDQAKNWKRVLKDYFFKAFKKVSKKLKTQRSMTC